jgi:hypothetical protein
MTNYHEAALRVGRRAFLRGGGLALGAMALGALRQGDVPLLGLGGRARPAARAKHVIYLHMSGGPPQQELFDRKPLLERLDGQPCPPELIEGRRFAFTRGVPNVLGPRHGFVQAGDDGRAVCALMPQFAKVVDKVCMVHSMTTDQFNHAPAELRLFTGSPVFGGASLGAWVQYGLGSENADLPGYVVMVSGQSDPTGGKSLWGSGFLPPQHQGVRLRSQGAPILFLDDPAGLGRELRGASVDALARLGELDARTSGDPQSSARAWPSTSWRSACSARCRRPSI